MKALVRHLLLLAVVAALLPAIVGVRVSRFSSCCLAGGDVVTLRAGLIDYSAQPDPEESLCCLSNDGCPDCPECEEPGDCRSTYEEAGLEDECFVESLLSVDRPQVLSLLYFSITPILANNPSGQWLEPSHQHHYLCGCPLPPDDRQPVICVFLC